MLDMNEVAKITGWFGLMFAIGYVAAWSADKLKKRKADGKPEEIAYETQTAILKSADHNTTPQMRIGFIDAMNGRILEVSTQIPHPGVANHYDWKTEMYVVPEDQKLSEAISTVMLMKGLDR
jgi:hypothetical protein